VQTDRPDVKQFYDESSGTLTYVVSDSVSKSAAIIDPVLGFSTVSGRTDTALAEQILAYVDASALSVEWILETHAHADHLSAAQFLKSKTGARVAIGEGIRDVQAHFGKIFNLPVSFMADGSQFDHLFTDGEQFSLGEMECSVLHTPGHTNDSVTYRVGNCAFVGDSLFMPDFGTARCDFPGGDASLLYESIQKLFALPNDTRLHMCHDYPPEGRALRYEISVAEQKEENKHVGGGTTKESFVAMREARDDTLSLPTLILPSIQVNICAGNLPDEDDNGIAYIRIPLNTL
jgi:glyoxylase-like metal-dependent hydrolase (beta-lactamase superfamily II)